MNRHFRRRERALSRAIGRSDALDSYNDRLAEAEDDDDRLVTLHPTKGYRSLSLKRLEAAELMEKTKLGWCRVAKKVAA